MLYLPSNTSARPDLVDTAMDSTFKPLGWTNPKPPASAKEGFVHARPDLVDTAMDIGRILDPIPPTRDSTFKPLGWMNPKPPASAKGFVHGC